MKKNILGIVLIFLLAISVSVNIFLAVDKNNPKPIKNEEIQQIDKNTYQIVFFNSSDRQVYIGKLAIIDAATYKLTKVYYFANERNKLTKLGDEDTKPQDALVIPKANVLYWENLKNLNQFGGVLK